MRPLTATRFFDELARLSHHLAPDKCRLTLPLRRWQFQSHKREAIAEYLKQVIEKKDASVHERCRPRVVRLEVNAFDPRVKRKNKVDIAFLQDLPDQLDALRKCAVIMFGSSTEIYRRLDVNGTGSLTVRELEAGLQNNGIPWQQVTGWTRVQLFNRVDPGKSGAVDILEFLGKEELTARPHWSELSTLEQWEEYSNKVIDLDLMNLEYSGPLWCKSGSGLARKLEALEESSKRKLNRLLQNSTYLNPRSFDEKRTHAMSREDLDHIQTKVVQIEKFLKDYNENKRDLIKIKMDLANVTESQERLAEMRRRREEEERERQRRKTEAGMALVSDGNSKISIFGKKSLVELTQFREPTEAELPLYFSLTNPSLLNESEIQFRNLLKSLNMSLVEGDKVRRAFLSHCSSKDGFMNIDEFGNAISDLIDMTLPLTRLQLCWSSASSDDRLSLDQFVSWFSTFYD